MNKVFLYSAPPPRFAEEIFAAFRRKYPAVECGWDHAPATQLFSRTLEEIAQGRCPADVMLLNRQQAEGLKQQGLLQPYLSPEAECFPEVFRDPDGFGTQVVMVPFSVAYHTGKVPPEEVPTTYEEILHPRWKGKLLYPDPRRSGSASGWYAVIKDRLGEPFLLKLAAQDPICKHDAEEWLAEGEGSILLAANVGHIEEQKNRGAPVDWVPMPVMMFAGPCAVLFRHAKHPEEGKRLIDFLLSEAGQEIMSGYHIPNRPGVTIREPLFASVRKRLEGCQLVTFTAKHGREYEANQARCIALFVEQNRRSSDTPS